MVCSPADCWTMVWPAQWNTATAKKPSRENRERLGGIASRDAATQMELVGAGRLKQGSWSGNFSH